jgi:ABC-2 type transport system permease protein
MTLRRTLSITGRLLSQFRHDRRTLALLFVAPLVILGIFALLFQTEAVPPEVGVIDQDSGPLGAAIVEQLTHSDLVSAHTSTPELAAKALDAGDIDGFVVLPSDLSTTALASGRIGVELHLRGTDPGSAAMVSRAVTSAALAAVSGLVRAGAGGGTLPTVDLQPTYLFGAADLKVLDLLGGPFIGLIVFFLVYVVTSISFLRERTEGTLERLMASPLRRSEIVLGYALGFTAVAVVQAAEVLVFCLWLIGLYNAGNVLLVFGIEVLLALAAINLGIFLSTFARNEFQAVQFIPIVIVPQFLLSGVLVPVASEPGWLQVVSNVLPLTYAVDALRSVMLEGRGLGSSALLLDLGVLAGFCVLAIIAAAGTLRREVA